MMLNARLHIVVTVRYASTTADLRSPELWFSRARKMRRKIICHTGPTNSGKTHAALTALANAKTGVYCGPLRLLASEVYTTLNERYQIPTCLRTGQELEEVANACHLSSTVEMCPFAFGVGEGGVAGAPWECAVIDEAQLIGDTQRGWAWTRALLGLEAHEIHLCGSPSMLSLVRRLVNTVTFDELEERSYKRLSPLRVDPSGPFAGDNTARRGKKSSFAWMGLRAGDAVVAFSRRRLHDIKRSIDRSPSPHKACIIYGGLPPDARRKQAHLFNDPGRGDYSVLVASDAVGLGLNLSIRRVIFTCLEKFDGQEYRPLRSTEIKQVAGRAGRFAGDFGDEGGLVTAVDRADYAVLRGHLRARDRDVRSAGLFPSADQLVLFAKELGVRYIGIPPAAPQSESRKSVNAVTRDVPPPADEPRHCKDEARAEPSPSDSSMPLEELLVLFSRAVTLDESDNYHLCDLGDMHEIAAILSDVDFSGASRSSGDAGFRHRYAFCSAPVDTSSPAVVGWFLRWAREYAASAALLDDEAPTPTSSLLPNGTNADDSSIAFRGPHGEQRSIELHDKLSQFDAEPKPVRIGFQLDQVLNNDIDDPLCALTMPRTPKDLRDLEDRHAALELYQWLAIRFPRFFTERAEAEEQATAVSDLLTRGLQHMTERGFKGETERQQHTNEKATPQDSRLLKKLRKKNAKQNRVRLKRLHRGSNF